MEIKPLRTKRDYEAALKDIDGLTDAKRLATGAGKTTVMDMLIAGQTVNAAPGPGFRG